MRNDGSMKLEPRDLEHAFSECFLEGYHTVLVGGGAEPLYFPSDHPERRPHRVVYREDYFASALHEVAHWCVAGPARRTREDYGYWYRPDGRNREEQFAFENVEAEPRALEWIFSEACGFSFHISVDNLTLGVDSSGRFERAVEAQRKRLIAKGLPRRAAIYRRALVRFMESRRHPLDLGQSRPGNRPA